MRDADRRSQIAYRERTFGQQCPGSVLREALILIDLGHIALKHLENMAQQGADGVGFRVVL